MDKETKEKLFDLLKTAIESSAKERRIGFFRKKKPVRNWFMIGLISGFLIATIKDFRTE